jgi:hypothetical protein
MPFFISLDLALSFFIQTHSRFMVFFLSEWCNYLGIALMGFSSLALLARKLSLSLRFDLFCCGSILTWISTWPPFFNEDSPVIFFYPVYFCLLTVFVMAAFIQQAITIDEFTLHFLVKFNNAKIFNSWILMGIVIFALNYIDNYLFYPTTMSVLIAKFAFSRIAELRAA